jgi:hypothetical protein
LEPTPAEAGGDEVLAGAARAIPIPAGAGIVIGYDYALTGRPEGWEIPGMLRKELTLVRSLSESDLQRTRLNFHFFYAAFPGTRGDEYFQSVTLAGGDDRLELRLHRLRRGAKWGDDQVVGPFVRITDAAGRETRRLLVFEGSAGSFEAAKPGPLRASAAVPGLPVDFRLFLGYARYLDNAQPGLAGGPELLEIPRPGAGGPAGR